MVVILPSIKDINNYISYYEKAINRGKNTRAAQISKMKTIHDRHRLLDENKKLDVISFQQKERMYYLKFYKKLLKDITEYIKKTLLFAHEANKLNA